MKPRLVIVICSLAIFLSGCGWMKAHWPWREQDVPITEPSEVAETTEWKPSPDEGPSEPPVASQPVPEFLGTPLTEPHEAPAEAFPTAPAAPAVAAPASRPVEEGGQPIRLTDLADDHQAHAAPGGAQRAKSPPPAVVLQEPEIVSGAVLQVNGRYVGVDEVLRGAAGQLRALPKALPEQAFRSRASGIIDREVQDLIAEELVLAEAQKQLQEQHKKHIDQQVDQMLEDMIAEAGGSRSKLESDLADSGVKLKDLLNDRRRQLMVRLYVRWRLMPAILVNRRTLWEYYDKHRGEFATPGKVQMQIVAAPLRSFLAEGVSKPSGLELDAARTAAMDQIRLAQEAIRGGEDFGEVAKRLSRGIKSASGGVWPMMPAGSFRESDVEEAAFAMAEGQVSDMISTARGCYIVKAKKIQPGSVVSFEDAQEDIEEELRERQYTKLSREYFDRMFEGATIVRSDKFLKQATDRAVEIYWRQ